MPVASSYFWKGDAWNHRNRSVARGREKQFDAMLLPKKHKIMVLYQVLHITEGFDVDTNISPFRYAVGLN